MDVGYIQGFFGRLCSVDVPGRAIILTTDQVDHGRRVGGALAALSIECAMSVRQDRLKMRISGRENLTKFKETIGFLDMAKATKLNELLDQYGG